MQIGFSSVRHYQSPLPNQSPLPRPEMKSETSFSLRPKETRETGGSKFEFPPAGTDEIVRQAWQKALSGLPSESRLMANATALTSINVGNPEHPNRTNATGGVQFQTTPPQNLADWKNFADRWIQFYEENSKQFPDYAEPLELFREFRSNMR